MSQILLDTNVVLDVLLDRKPHATAAAAEAARCDWLITRDPAGFRKSPVSAVAPEAALPLLVERVKGPR